MHRRTQNGRRRQTLQHRNNLIRRRLESRRLRWQLQSENPQKPSLRDSRQLHRLRRMQRRMSNRISKLRRHVPGRQKSHIHPLRSSRPTYPHHQPRLLHRMLQMRRRLRSSPSNKLRPETPRNRSQRRSHNRHHWLRHVRPQRFRVDRIRQIFKRVHRT